MTIELFKYQRQDVDKLKGIKSRLIGSDMGTGKSYEAIFLDLEERELVGPGQGPTLNITKISCFYDWEAYWLKVNPDLKIKIINPKDREEFQQALLAKNYDVYIVHWQALRLLPALGMVKFFHVIADEVQAIANRKAQVTRALKVIKTEYKTAISGTYYGDKPWNAWSVLNWLWPSYYRSYWKYDAAFVESELVIEQNRRYRRIKGPKNTELLLAEMRPFYVRHLKRGQCCPEHPNGVQAQLPPVYHHTVPVDLYPEQRKAYDQMRKDMIAWLGEYPDETPMITKLPIAKAMRLNQLSIAYADVKHVPQPDGLPPLQVVKLREPSCKLDAMQDKIDETEDQIVIFTNLKDVVELIKARMAANKTPISVLTGDTSPTKRFEAISAFRAGDTKLFVGTVEAGGEGIDLSVASRVIFIDWHHAAYKNNQAISRLDRIGQVNAVEVIDIVARDTVDIRKLVSLKTKKEWMRLMLGDS